MTRFRREPGAAPPEPIGTVARARQDGYFRGCHDMHYEVATYRTGAEWVAWFDGWKAGQAERKERECRRAA